jgi:hypothetical protein
MAHTNKLLIQKMNEWESATGTINEITLFTLINHRINNTGWVMKWWWRERWNEVQTPILRECWTFLIYIFLHQKRKQCLEFALPKPGEICKHLAGAYNQTAMPVGFTFLLLYAENKQKNQCNGASRFKEKYLRKAQHYQSSLKEEKALICIINPFFCFFSRHYFSHIYETLLCRKMYPSFAGQ